MSDRARRRARAFERIRRRLQFELGAVRGFTLDVSAGGLNLELPRTPAPTVGSTVVGTLLVGASRRLSFTGLVAWALPAFPHIGIRGKAGIRLTGIAPEFYEALAGR